MKEEPEVDSVGVTWGESDDCEELLMELARCGARLGLGCWMGG